MMGWLRQGVVGVFLVCLGSTMAIAYPRTPDPEMTSGELCSGSDKHYAERRYAEKIAYCKRRVSQGMKKRIYISYGVPLECKKHYTIDHFIPLSIGGNNARQNLWPEHKLVKKVRQNLEFEVYEDLRDGYLTHKEAVDIIYEAKMNPPDKKDYPSISANCW